MYNQFLSPLKFRTDLSQVTDKLYHLEETTDLSQVTDKLYHLEETTNLSQVTDKPATGRWFPPGDKACQ
jgi:hypothetical protein